MKSTLLSILLFSSCSFVTAQERHFIYIQSNNNQPFYVNLNNTIYSSTASGYVNISQLLQGKYYLTIGFAKNIYPEQKFIVDIEEATPGLGFSLMQKNNTNWYLSNYITNEIINSDNEIKISTENVVKKEVVKSIPPVIVPATVAIQNIIKSFEKKSSQGVDLIYIDQSNSAKPDTITIFIAANIAETETANPSSSASPIIPVNSKQIQENCKYVANNEDFFKLRLDMAAANTEEKMLVTAEKSFAAKCFLTGQLKNLSVLFLSEENRLQFFQLAQYHVADSENFSSLQSQFANQSTRAKFNTLLKTKQ
jgi:hypothetical protein